MKKILIISCLTTIMAAKIFSQTLWRSELVGKPTDTSISIKVFFADSVELCAQYGTTSGVYSGQTVWQTFADSLPAEILIFGLQANTKYYYRLCYRAPGATVYSTRPEYTFHTQRLPGSSFTFVVQADPHLDEQSDTALYRLCLKNQLEDEPDFMIDLGDFLMTDKLKNIATNTIPFDTIPYRCNLLRSYYETSSHSVPLYIALGNHEGEAGWNLNGNPNNIAVWDAQQRKKFFLNPSPNTFYSGDTSHQNYIGQRENYYAWKWGDALFIVLDPYWYTTTKPDSLHGWRWTLGKVQYDWLKNVLETNNATFKYVFAHHLIGGDPEGRGGVEFADRYEWGGNNLDGTPGFAVNRPGWYKPIKDLLTEHRVNVFFHGHDHFFGKQDKDCLVYQESPQPSHPNFTSANQAAGYGYFAGQILPNSGHLRVTVSPSGMQVDYVRVYLPANETATRHNKDVSATYFIGAVNCYDSISTGIPVIWNSNYSDELVYPNPFEEQTKIEFNLEKAEKIYMTIADANGRIVRTLLNGNLISVGRFQVSWDGRDAAGNDLNDGVYFYSIKGDGPEVRNGKLVLAR